MWMSARTACCRTLGRNGGTTFAAIAAAEPEGPLPWSSALAELGETAPALAYCSLWALMRYLSYSLVARRRASRTMTRRMTPMQEPANMPLEVIFPDGVLVVWYRRHR